MSGALTRFTGAIVRARHRLPRPIARMLDRIGKNPDGIVARIADAVLGRGAVAPPPTPAPPGEVRVYVAPTNYAAQGHLWARALEAVDARIGARNMEIVLPGGFGFPADVKVPLAIYNRALDWARSEFEAVGEGFTHVLVEAERPLFGALFARDAAAEVEALAARGVSVALIAHGTDVRSPREHLARHRWSPYADDAVETRRLQHDADRNLAFIAESGLPVFVSTPDLLLDVPRATWCPVVVDPARWVASRPAFDGMDPPVVVHVPSASAVKGTSLIEPVLARLDAEGVLRYRALSGVPSSRMPATIGAADIVLDQFRVGSYGVAACEAMAAGRVVVGSVLAEVRDLVRSTTGCELPLVEADPDSLERVLRDLVADRPAATRIAAAGPGFVAEVHDGTLSARRLVEGWIGS